MWQRAAVTVWPSGIALDRKRAHTHTHTLFLASHKKGGWERKVQYYCRRVRFLQQKGLLFRTSFYASLFHTVVQSVQIYL